MSQLVKRAERLDGGVPLEGVTHILGGWRPKSNRKSVILDLKQQPGVNAPGRDRLMIPSQEAGDRFVAHLQKLGYGA
jgi:hypothetical protein